MKHSPQARLLVSTLVTAIAVAVAWSIMHTPLRMPANLKTNSTPPRGTSGKPSSSLIVSIEQIEQSLPTLGLNGRIHATQALNGYRFAWIVPSEDRIVDGAATGTIPVLSAGDALNLGIQVDRTSTSTGAIVLHVYQLINGEPRGVLAQWDPQSLRPIQNSQEKAKALPDGLVQ